MGICIRVLSWFDPQEWVSFARTGREFRLSFTRSCLQITVLSQISASAVISAPHTFRSCIWPTTNQLQKKKKEKEKKVDKTWNNIIFMEPVILVRYEEWIGARECLLCSWWLCEEILEGQLYMNHLMQKQALRSFSLSYQKKAWLAIALPSLFRAWHATIFYSQCHMKRRLGWAGASEDFLWYGNDKDLDLFLRDAGHMLCYGWHLHFCCSRTVRNEMNCERTDYPGPLPC